MNTSAFKTVVGVGAGVLTLYVAWKLTTFIVPGLVIVTVAGLGYFWWKGGQKPQ